MKRVLAWMLLLVMVLGMFAGCKPQEDPTPTTEPVTTAPQGEQSGVQGPGAQDAMDYLKSLYQEDGTETPVDYNRYGIIRVGGIEFKIEWSVDVAEDFVKVVVNEDGTVTIDINEQCEEATPYVLTATITDENGNVATHTWNHILPKAQDMVEIVKAAYALGKGESLPYQSRLIGKVVSIDAIWTDEYQNITVTIEVEGAEDMPIKCYRMKGNDNTITVIKDLKVGNIITVLGILKNYEGTIEFDAGCILEKVEKGDAVDAPTDPGEILKAAYALKQDEALPYQATLTGRVIEIDSPYDPNYGNISVIIEVEGYEKYPMLCYRLKGTGVEDIAIDDLITVTGIIKNYRGTIEYDAGCMMTERISGGGVAQKPSSDAAKILADAAKLSAGEKLPYRATLTGEIYSVDNAYDPNFGNVTVTIKVNGVKIQCYRMVGDGIDQIRETDTITVTGVIENYNGKLEFGAKCNLDSWEKGPRNVNYGPVDEDVAYRLYINQTGVNKTVYFNGEFKSNRLQTTAIGSEGADVYAERISGRGLRFFYMDGETKTYIEIEEFTNDEGKQRGGLRVTTEPSCYWVYNSECGVYIVNLPTAGKYFMGTYGTYETISASWIGYIDGSYSGGSTQYVAKFIEADQVQDVEPEPTEPTEPSETLPVVTDTLENGDRVVIYAPAYNKALSADKVNTGSYYNKGVDITVANGEVSGYGDAEIWTVVKNADGTYSFANGGKNIGLAAEFSSMNLGAIHDDWTLISLGDGLYNIKNVGRGNFIEWYDAKGNWSTYNSSSAATDGQFQLSIYIVGEGLLGEETTEPDVTEPEATEPEATEPEVTEPGTSAALNNGDKVVIFAPAYNKALSADKVNTGSYYNKGVDITVANGEVSGYGDAEIWTVVKNADGTYSFANGGKNIGLAADYSSMNLGAIHDDWTLISLGDGLYNIRNVGRGNFIEWYDEKGNWSTYNSSSAATDGQFQLSFYIIGEGILGDETVEPEVTEPEVTEPEVTEPEVTEPSVSVALDNGDKVVIFAPAYNKALSADKVNTGSYYNKGVDVTVANGEVSGYGDAEIWTVVKNADGTYSFANGGKNIGLAADYSSMNLGAIHDDWTLISLGDGLYNIKNVGRGNFIEWYDEKGNWSTYNSSYAATDGQFQLSFYIIGEGILGDETVEPEVTEPEVTEPEVTEPEVTEPSVSVALDNGDKVVIFAPAYNKALSADKVNTGSYYNKGVDITVANGEVSGYGDAEIWTVVKNADGTYSFANGGKNIGLAADYSSMNLGAIHDDWTLISLGDGLYNIKNVGRGNFIEWYDEKGNWSSYNSSYAATDDQFQLSFYIIGEGILGDETVEPEVTEPEVTEPEVTEPEVTEPEVTEPTVSGNGYIKVTSEAEFTSGKYVMIVSSGYAPGVFDNGWLSAVQPVVSGNVVTDTKDAVWTITVNGDSVTFTDSNGVTIKPKGGNYNGVLEGSYNWAWSFENGTFKFAGTGSDTVVLASNATTTGQYPGNHRFRGYKTTTVSSQASNYPCAFTLYKLSEGTGVEPEVTEPEVTVPEATEPEATNPGSSEPAIYPFIIVAEDAGVAMTTVSQDKTYGYLPKTDVTVVDGVLNGITADNVFYMVTIEEGEDYAIVYMVDYYGRVLYMTGTFNSCNFSNEIPAEGAEWKLTLTEDGRIYITNILKDKTFGYSSEFSSFGVYPDASKHTALLFVPVEIIEEDPNATEPEVTEPEATEPEATEPVAGSSVTYTFANYTAGTAYGAEEEHYLDENMTVFTYECYFTKQLRLYQDDKGDGRAVFTSSKAITSVVINAGYRVADLEVYGSVDGENWVLIDTISHPTKDAYADYSVQFPADAQYKYMKLDAVGGQIRIPYITFNFAG